MAEGKTEKILRRSGEDARSIHIECVDGQDGRGDGYKVTVELKRPKSSGNRPMAFDDPKYRKEFVFGSASEDINEKETLACVKRFL